MLKEPTKIHLSHHLLIHLIYYPSLCAKSSESPHKSARKSTHPTLQCHPHHPADPRGWLAAAASPLHPLFATLQCHAMLVEAALAAARAECSRRLAAFFVWRRASSAAGLVRHRGQERHRRPTPPPSQPLGGGLLPPMRDVITRIQTAETWTQQKGQIGT